MTPDNQAAAQERAPGRIWIGWPHNPADDSWYFLQPDIGNAVPYVRADLLQQPASGERCGESILRPLCAEHPHVSFVDGVLGGAQPLINATRVGVSHLLGRMAIGMSLAEYKETWSFDDETLKDAFAYAQDVIEAVIDRERKCVYPATDADHDETAWIKRMEDEDKQRDATQSTATPAPVAEGEASRKSQV